MVKNKALLDSARPYKHPRLVILSLSLPRRFGPLKAGLVSFSLADTVHPEGTTWILPRLDPSTGPRGGPLPAPLLPSLPC